jgi:hypothetical protein
MLRRLELLAALVILVSCALPFATCTRYVSADGKPVEITEGAELPPGVVKDVDVQRPIESFDLLDLEMYPFMLAFVWPLAFAGIFARWPGARRVRTLRVLQLLLLLGSAYVFTFHATFLSEPAWGFFVAMGALALYLVVWALDLRDHWPRARGAPA